MKSKFSLLPPSLLLVITGSALLLPRVSDSVSEFADSEIHSSSSSLPVKSSQNERLAGPPPEDPSVAGMAHASPGKYTITWSEVQHFATGKPGDIVHSSSTLSGTVIYSGALQGVADSWMVAIKVDGEEDLILTIAREPDQRVLARMYSPKIETAWHGSCRANETLILEQVHRNAILPVCASPPAGAGVSGTSTGVVPLRQSLPGALRVLYLDFDGENISGTSWNASENGGNPINAAASGLSTAEIEQVWQEVAEDFRPFQVNVTTDRAAYQAAFTGYRMMAVITRTDGWYNDKNVLPDDKAGGVAFLSSFGNVSDLVCWVFSNRTGAPSNIAVAVSHEFGHTLGLGHYGDYSLVYYKGHGTGPESWGPIMGAPYRLQITQWSNGDYPGAFNYIGQIVQIPPQNDVGVISERLPLRNDEDSNTVATARNLHPNSSLDTPTALALYGEGIIHSRTDVDYLYFDAPSAGQLLINAMPFSSTGGTGVNLNVKLRLLNPAGTVLANAAPANDPSSQISFPVTAAERFVMEIDGAGKDGGLGYSDYGSIGCYLMRGSFTASGPPVIAKQPDAVSRVILGGGFTLAVQASGAAPLNYQWQRRSNPSAPWQNVGLNQATYTAATAVSGDSGQYRVIVSNSPGSATSQIASVTVGTLPSNVQYQWRNFAGKPGGNGFEDGVGQLASFKDPSVLFSAADGSLLICDERGLRRMHPNSFVQTLYEGHVGAAVQDAAGFVYFSSGGSQSWSGPNAILRRSPDGTVVTYAGLPGTEGYLNGPRLTARFKNIAGIALHPGGGLVVIDDYMIRRIDGGGQVSTLAGSSGVSGYLDGTGGAARFYDPKGVVVDSTGAVYVSDRSAHTIRRITPAGTVSTFAGRAYYYGGEDGPRNDARFWYPSGLALDAQGRLLIADSRAHTIRRVDTAGAVSTIAGEYNAFGDQDGPALNARFGNPTGIGVRSDGSIFVSEVLDKHRIRRISTAAVVSTVAGSTRLYGDTDGLGEDIRFQGLRGVDVGPDGSVYAISGHSIRRLQPFGESFAFAGHGSESGSTEGNAANARFHDPRDIAITSAGTFYITDAENHVIRRITSAGVVSTFAGSIGMGGYVNSSGTAARFNFPDGVAVDPSGNLYVTERDLPAVRKITPSGAVTLFAGSPTEEGMVNGPGTSARFSMTLGGIACDSQGNVYVSDSGNYVIRRITPSGSVSTFSGTSGTRGSIDGPGSSARFSRPGNLAVDRLGNVIVADGLWWNSGSHTIRRIRPDGYVTTIGGTADRPGHADGIASGALFSYPAGVAVSTGGTIYVAEDGSGRIRIGTPALDIPSSIPASPSGSSMPDTDGDGASDQEEVLAGTNPNDPTSFLPVLQGQASTQDSDGDGMSDADEIIAGTDPTARESNLRIVSITPIKETNGQDSLEVAFSARPDRAYWLYRTDSPSSTNWEAVAGPLTVTNGAALINVTLPKVGNRAFFRVKVIAPGS